MLIYELYNETTTIQFLEKKDAMDYMKDHEWLSIRTIEKNIVIDDTTKEENLFL